MKAQPIRDKEKINRMLEILSEDTSRAGKRRYIMFMLGIYLGRRVSDMLPLTVGQIVGVDALEIKEIKTRKRILLPIPPRLKAALREEYAGRPADEYILLSPHLTKATGKHPDRKPGQPKPIDRRTAYGYMKDIGRMMGYGSDYNIATHTLRKTFGYTFYQTTHDIGTLMTLFNHSSEKVTKIYIGIEQDEISKAMSKVNTMYNT